MPAKFSFEESILARATIEDLNPKREKKTKRKFSSLSKN
jgi:hypothetical protein